MCTVSLQNFKLLYAAKLVAAHDRTYQLTWFSNKPADHNSCLCSTTNAFICMCHVCQTKKEKEKAMYAPCIYFKGSNQPMQAHAFQLVLNTNANFLAKVAHLIISVKK